VRPGERYLNSVHATLEKLELQQVLSAAELVADALQAGRLIHVFGGGHSALLAQEVFYRAGGLVAVRPMLDRRLQFEDGILQSTEFERMPGAALELAVAAEFRSGDVGIVASNSGRNVLPVEMACHMRAAGMKVIALTNLRQSREGKSLHPSGKRLFECADAVLDNHCPIGDAAVTISGIAAAMGPVSTIAGAALLHAVFIQAAAQLVGRGTVPAVFQSANVGDGSLDEVRSLIAPFQDRIKYYRTAPGPAS
jgi:uncharacterized phosphosugar-binding protein